MLQTGLSPGAVGCEGVARLAIAVFLGLPNCSITAAYG